MFDADVIIIGGGAAGLSCARRLQQAEVKWILLEKSDRLGGRIRTDLQDGFFLDHGFHTLQSKYPETKGLIDYKSLNCKAFAKGAKIFHNAGWHTIADPLSHPLQLFPTLFNGVSTLGDLLRLGWWSFASKRRAVDNIWQGREKTSLTELKEKGFTDRFIEGFFRPFMGGVMLDADLKTSARQMEFAMMMFSKAAPLLPAAGIASIVPSLSAGLPMERVRLNTTVVSRQGQLLKLGDGSELRGFQIVIATENLVAKDLIAAPAVSSALPAVSDQGTSTFYFEAPAVPPLKGPWLLLNGEPGGHILHGCFPSQVHPSYAPAGKQLFSATTLGRTPPLLEEIRTQMADWFGESSRSWPHLRTINVPHALPRRETLRPGYLPERLSEELFVCGDHRAYASLNAAIASGRRAAEAIIPETVF